MLSTCYLSMMTDEEAAESDRWERRARVAQYTVYASLVTLGFILGRV